MSIVHYNSIYSSVCTIFINYYISVIAYDLLLFIAFELFVKSFSLNVFGLNIKGFFVQI